ncbi:hypothetical protein [Erwinia sorbitola]|uniref:Glycosyltransferase RgtA/B/C/D-like domain-containing protein n=1 Tax=Erwinia sorbitola TaxID=2681984 RepID=A0A6I6EKH1_9GAMM|nr:hypothetical protein [Erwinia sorbitola]QGU86776.1 hypothetical protein GN242_05935 [Erwinia sorbitola]
MQKELLNKWNYSSQFVLLFFVITSILSIIKQLAVHYSLIDGVHSVFILSLIITTALLCAIRKKIDIWVLLPVVFLVISCVQAYIYPDQSWDGLAYHQKAAWYLMHGGNLLFDGDAGNYWVALYPKSTWFYAGELGAQLGSMQFSSSYQLLIGFGMYSYVIYFFEKNGYSPIAAHIFAFMSLMSPIFIAQSFSYYVDAMMGFLALVMMLSSIEYGNRRQTSDALTLILASIIVVNIKFSGFLYVGACFLILGLRSLPKVKETLKVCGIFAIFLVVGVGVIGANPYVKNLAEGKSIFYPLFGEGKKDIITFAQPVSFSSMNRFEKLFISTFSKSENINKAAGTEPTFKIPGAVSKNEIANLHHEDLRIAGFGPLYSLCLIMAIAFLLFSRGIDRNCKLLLVLIVLCTLLNPESWWARYAPHLYTLLLLPLLYIKPGERFKLSTAYIGLLIAVMLFNVGLMTKARINASRSFNNGLNWILNSCPEGVLHVTPLNNFIVEPLLQRGSGRYVMDETRQEGAKDYKRKFSYLCVR